MLPGVQFLQAQRVNRIFEALRDVREKPQDLVFLNREPVIPASDEEIIGKFIDYVQVADIIADDAEAGVYNSGKISYESNAVPNLKHGARLTQEMLNRLNRINAYGLDGPDAQALVQWERRTLDNLLLGIRQRMELLLVARACDSLTYNKLGIQIAGNWGMPAGLKVTVGTAWDNTSATPVSDVQTMQLTGSIKFGIKYDRLTMSTQAFRYMIATTEYQNKARAYIPAQLTFSNIQTLNLDEMRSLAETTMGVKIVLYDARYQTQNADGTRTFTPFLPIVNVILDSSQNDKNPNVQDFANGVVTESIMSQFVPTGMVGSLPSNATGPVAYVSAKSDMNPPNLTYFGVARGFPRKFLLQSQSCLTVGSFSDAISFGSPF